MKIHKVIYGNFQPTLTLAVNLLPTLLSLLLTILKLRQICQTWLESSKISCGYLQFTSTVPSLAVNF